MAFFVPATVYAARVNQTFSTKDKILQVTYDTGSGTLADVKEGMTMLVGSTAGGHDKGIVRIRKVPTATIFYVGEESDVKWADNDHLTVINDFDLWARHLTLSGSTPLIDGDIAYSNQHTSFDPVPIMGSHRVLKLTGASVSTQYDWSASWVYDSTISAYSCSAPTASGSSGMTTATPTVTFNTVGWHVVFVTVTAANGKTTTGVRYVYVWSDASPPPSAEIGVASCDMGSGGWKFPVTMYANASVSSIRDRTLVILFAEDYYGATNQSIGPLAGCENVMVIGRISAESIDWHPEQGKVNFTVHGAQHWFAQMKGFPSGLKMVTDTPASWIEMGNLTVGRALFHFLHFRTTATRVMDIYLTSDSRLLAEVSAPGAKLWTQMTEFAFNTILANLGVDRYGRLFCEIDPQMIPAASRGSIPIVMTITKQDWQEVIPFPRQVVEEVGLIDLSGVYVNASTVGSSFFSLSPGHVMKRFGDDQVIDHLAAYSTQSANNQVAGLMLGWKDNELPQVDIQLSANNRLFDCYPNQYAQIMIAAGDTPRGIAYSGKLIPRYVAFQPRENGYVYTEISFEAETFEQNSTNGDIPFGSADPSIPPIPSIPAMPIPPIVIPGFPEGSPDGPTRVLLHDTSKGLIYSENFEASGASVKWRTVNAGLPATQYQNINTFFVTPNGALYAAWIEVVDSGDYASNPFFIARAPSIGGTFDVIYEEADIRPSPLTGNWGLFGAGYNPLVSEQVAFVLGVVNLDKKVYVGSGSSFTPGVAVDATSIVRGGLSYGLGAWLYTRFTHYSKISPTGGSILGTGSPGIDALDVFTPFLSHVRASSTGRTFHRKSGGGGYVIGENNLATVTTFTDANFVGTGLACDPSGMLIMVRYNPGARGRSSDGGATWLPIPNLTVGNWWWSYAGGAGNKSRWVAAGGSSIRYSPDFGDTWVNKEGNIQSIAPVPSINGVKVVGF